jgi:hypothetical protein
LVAEEKDQPLLPLRLHDRAPRRRASELADSYVGTASAGYKG